MSIEIHMHGVASYKNPTVLETDKKLTLVYGLNGTGKSTLSNYLYNSLAGNYSSCKKVGLDDASVYVYNATFVRDNFYEKDNLRGIFTLSKANKDVEEKLALAKKEMLDVQAAYDTFQRSINDLLVTKESLRSRAEEAVWPIKTKFTGGDRVLAYCLTGLQIKAKLFDHLLATSCPLEQPTESFDSLKSNAEVLQDSSAVKLASLSNISSFALSDANRTLLSTVIVGNENSSVAGLIRRLQHADWVAEGITYIDSLTENGEDMCPFCQQRTLSKAVAASIKEYFDESFATSVQGIKDLNVSYDSHCNSLEQTLREAQQHTLLSSESKGLLIQYIEALHSIFELNKAILSKKSEHPSQVVELYTDENIVGLINEIINGVNSKTTEHNKNLDDRTSALSKIKKNFWEICRWDYSRNISDYTDGTEKVDKNLIEQRKKLKEISEKKATIQDSISILQMQVVNVDHAVSEINSRLMHMGIDSFQIAKVGENSYQLVRNAVGTPAFLSLSEGEKTVISFLYFMELCKGQLDPGEVLQRKVLVIDDPISSLSHLYMFNIGRAIREELCESTAFEKIIVLTHSLYFFYELTDINHERRAKTQKLIRLVKGADGSRFEKMSYESIQNDYHAYWSVIKDPSSPPALIANCMRNVIEYFFGFVKKSSLANTFAKLKEPHHQAFYRYVNRESHSLGQNIYDFKEFDYGQFRDSLKHVFYDTGFQEHYDAMMAV